MHELALAQSIVEQADSAARDACASAVTRLHVRIGMLSGVLPDALVNCWEIAAFDSLLSQSELTCEMVPVTIACGQCRCIVTPDVLSILRCPDCGTPSNDVRTGRELELAWVEYQ